MLLPTAPLDYPRIKLLTVGDVGVGKSCFIKRYCEGRFVAKYIPTIGIDYGVKKMDVKAARYAECKQKQKKQNSNSSAAVTHAVPPTAVRVNFWDAAGGAESLEVRNEFYGATQGIFLMYDVRNAESFASLDRWLDELRAYIALSEETSAKTSEGANGMPVTRRTSTTAQTPAGKAVGDTNGRAPIIVLCANKVDDVGEGSTRRVVSEAEGRQWAKAHGCAAYFETSASTGQNVAEAIECLFYEVLGKFM